LRTGLTTVGHAGADVGMPDKGVTMATALKAQGYATGQFGKNHLGDLNKYLPTLHGFDEFHDYLYHFDALSDPYWFSYPREPAFLAKYGPRNVLHCWATDKDDATEMPRWGKVGKQKIQDDGPLPPHPSDDPNAKFNMETVDDVFLKSAFDFMDKSKKDGKPFFVWHNGLGLR
jgi:arylsulfatase